MASQFSLPEKDGQLEIVRQGDRYDEEATRWARGYIGLSILGRTERFERVVE
jgi:hypothetical protein